MEKEEIKEEQNQSDAWRLIDQVSEKTDLTFRDDQHDFDWFVDALKQRRRKGLRFRLVDSGVFDGNQLEDLAAAGADIYTSDRVRTDVLELEFILKSAAKGGGIVAFFLHGGLSSEGGTGFLSLSALSLLGKKGLFIHVSNREKERNASDLIPIAIQCRLGSSRLVCYNHRRVTPEWVELGKEGAWIHVSDMSFQSEEDLPVLLDTVAAARSAGTNCVFYVERGMPFSSLREIVNSGAIVQFKTAPKDFKSPLKPVEDEARKKHLDFRTYYLYPNFLP